MAKITLKIYPTEFAAMISYLHGFKDVQQLPLARQTVTQLVLIHYAKTWNMERMMSWGGKSPKKAYSISLSLPVARAFHQDMQSAYLTPFQRSFLDKLDQAIIDYRRADILFYTEVGTVTGWIYEAPQTSKLN